MHSVTNTVVASVAIALLAAATPVGAQHAGHGIPAPPTPPSASGQRASAPAVFPPQQSAGAVTLSVAPRWADGRLVLLMRAETHAGDLASLDLRQAVRLVVNGAIVAPAAADSLHGHQAVGTVVFPLAARPERFTVEIRSVPGAEPRALEWPPRAPTSPPAPRR